MSDNKNTQGNQSLSYNNNHQSRVGNEEIISESKQVLMSGPPRVYPESPSYQQIEPIYESKQSVSVCLVIVNHEYSTNSAAKKTTKKSNLIITIC